MIKLVLIILQIISGIATITLIFFQSQGNLESNSNLLSSNSVPKRGWEKITFIMTIITAILFLVLSILQTVL